MNGDDRSSSGEAIDMGALLDVLRARMETNAKQATEAYAREVAEYGSPPDGTYDFALFLRQRTLDLAPDRPLTDGDLAAIAAVGCRRARAGFSLASQQQVLALHTSLLLREIHEAARDEDVNDLLRLVGWFGVQGLRARAAYLRGFTDGVGRSRALATRLELLARALLADEPPEPFLVDGVCVRPSGRATVSVLRPVPVPGEPNGGGVDRVRVPHRLVAAWLTPDEYVVVTAEAGERDRALAEVRGAVEAIGHPCRIGSADGTVGRLAAALTSARQVSGVAPPEEHPTRLYAMADLFVELSVAASPAVDVWLRDFGRRLADGPSLVETLHTYYRHDMSRSVTAATLNIHPRTLDYRLRRVRHVTGVDPGSTLGIRVLSAAVTRARAT
jgi:hypothetical protein